MRRFAARSPQQRVIVAMLGGFIALAVGGYAASRAASELAFEQRAVRLDGQVVGLEPMRRHSARGQAYAPVFRITPPNATPIDVPSRVGSRPAAWTIGDRASVLFDPGAPDHVVADTLGQRWGVSLAFGGAALFFALVGLVALVG